MCRPCRLLRCAGQAGERLCCRSLPPRAAPTERKVLCWPSQLLRAQPPSVCSLPWRQAEATCRFPEQPQSVRSWDRAHPRLGPSRPPPACQKPGPRPPQAPQCRDPCRPHQGQTPLAWQPHPLLKKDRRPAATAEPPRGPLPRRRRLHRHLAQPISRRTSACPSTASCAVVGRAGRRRRCC